MIDWLAAFYSESGNPTYLPEPVISFITPVHHQAQVESFMPSLFGKDSESTVSPQSVISNDLIDMLSLDSAESKLLGLNSRTCIILYIFRLRIWNGRRTARGDET